MNVSIYSVGTNGNDFKAVADKLIIPTILFVFNLWKY
jgi:hypothetical protein